MFAAIGQFFAMIYTFAAAGNALADIALIKANALRDAEELESAHSVEEIKARIKASKAQAQA